MPAAVVRGTSVSFGIPSAVTTIVATNLTANASSNKVEAKNINGGTAAVAFIGKKVEYNMEGYFLTTNSATQGAVFSPTNLAGFANISGGYYVEEVTLTKTAEDFAKLKYKVVQRDGVS